MAIRDASRSRGLGPVAGALLLALGAGWVMNLGCLQVVVCVLLLPVLVMVCARSAGQTDVSPNSQVGQLAQVVLGASGATSGGGIIGAGMVAGVSAQASVSLWSAKAGELLGAPVRAERSAQLIGVAVGAVTTGAAYLLLTSGGAIGTAEFPAPAAAPWKAVALVAERGLRALPEGAAAAALVAGALGAVLALSRRSRLAAWLPEPEAMGVGFLLPSDFAAAVLAGSVLSWTFRRLRGKGGETAAVVGAGAIVGESVAGLLATIWKLE